MEMATLGKGMAATLGKEDGGEKMGGGAPAAGRPRTGRPRTGRARAGGAHPGGGEGGTAEAPAAAGVPHPCKREQASHLQAGVAGQRPQTGVLAEAAGAAAEGQRRPGR